MRFASTNNTAGGASGARSVHFSRKQHIIFRIISALILSSLFYLCFFLYQNHSYLWRSAQVLSLHRMDNSIVPLVKWWNMTEYGIQLRSKRIILQNIQLKLYDYINLVACLLKLHAPIRLPPLSDVNNNNDNISVTCNHFANTRYFMTSQN